MHIKSNLFLIALLGLAVGCGDNGTGPSGEPPQPPPEDEPNAAMAEALLGFIDDGDGFVRVSCANISLAIADAGGSAAVIIDAPLYGPLEDTPHEVGTIVEIDLSQTPEALRVKFGSNLIREVCNDAIEPNGLPVVEAEFLPIAGTITIEVTEQLEVYPEYNARVTLTDVRFTQDGEVISLDLGVANFGWFPG